MSEGPVVKGQTLTLMENWGQWTCRYFGKGGILGNVTTHVQITSEFCQLLSLEHYNTNIIRIDLRLFLLLFDFSGGLSAESPGVSGNMGTVIGLGFLLIILMLFLLQMYKNHQRVRNVSFYSYRSALQDVWVVFSHIFRQKSKIFQLSVFKAFLALILFPLLHRGKESYCILLWRPSFTPSPMSGMRKKEAE